MVILKVTTDIILKNILKAFNWLKPVLKEFGIILLILFADFFLIRIYEFFHLSNNFNLKLSFVFFEFYGIYYDFLFIALISLIFFLPFTILFKISKKLSRILFYVINITLILIVFILIDYLKYTFIPLDHAIFAYPVNELLYIAKESVDLTFWDFIRYLIAIVLGIFLTYIIFRKLIFNKIFIVSIIFIVCGVFLTKNLNPARRNFSNDLTFNLTINKLSYFSKGCAKYILGTSELNNLEINKIVTEFHKINNDIPFDNLNYPLEHKPDTTDILSSYFNLGKEPPNLVFIIMESLSSAFCGSNPYLGSFTPFIDSLIDKSLYWENFLSTSERTFNVIPSIFGSLPYGEKGFMNLVQNDYTVDHSTLIKWLNDNGYQTNFFYGGWTGFDNMEKFMKYQNIDFILNHFGDNYSKIEKDENGLSWGYPDKSVYMRSFEILDSIQKKPRIDIHMTLSLHHPFRPPNNEYYHQKFKERMDQIGMNKKQKKETEIYSDIFSTVLYTDDALRYFLNQYKKREDYKNTIFVITGDHRIGSQNAKSKIDIYHVPFIIFSPMLKEPVRFSSVSSHANISPTFYPFLSKNFSFEIPQKVHWLGKQMDFEKKFRNTHIIPLMRTNREITDYISGDYLLSDGELFLLQDNLNLQLIENQDLLDSLKQDLANFVILNNYITQNNLLISNE